MSNRLPWLLGVLVVLSIVRWVFPPPAPSNPPEDLAVAIDRPGDKSSPRTAAAATEPVVAMPSEDPEAIEDVIGNAFKVRLPPPPPEPPPPPSPPRPPKKIAPAVVAPPPPPAAPPAPPLQVIGTWDDATQPGVFLTSPSGTILARVGTIVMSEYRIAEVGRHHVTLAHTTSANTWRLPISRAPTRP